MTITIACYCTVSKLAFVGNIIFGEGNTLMVFISANLPTVPLTFVIIIKLEWHKENFK